MFLRNLFHPLAEQRVVKLLQIEFNVLCQVRQQRGAVLLADLHIQRQVEPRADQMHTVRDRFLGALTLDDYSAAEVQAACHEVLVICEARWLLLRILLCPVLRFRLLFCGILRLVLRGLLCPRRLLVPVGCLILGLVFRPLLCSIRRAILCIICRSVLHSLRRALLCSLSTAILRSLRRAALLRSLRRALLRSLRRALFHNLIHCLFLRSSCLFLRSVRGQKHSRKFSGERHRSDAERMIPAAGAEKAAGCARCLRNPDDKYRHCKHHASLT
mmetsp:Transcript_41732/g.73373  ORF Transcript_41732/g.73373 Transcript_41732/m.73373 type:complete len:272 (-) Transcript_41732:113-928(-)